MYELSLAESDELAQCEATIAKGMETFVEVGTALLRIRDSRLYRETFGTFEDYCRGRWSMERRHAYRLIDAASVVSNVSNWTQEIPHTESQARPLTSLDPDDQREAWSRAVETAPNGKVTADHVKQTVDEMFPRVERPAPLDGQRSFFEPEPPRPRPWSESEYERKELVEAGHTVVANIKTDQQLIAWAEENGLYVRIDRQTAWGNPFILDEDGDRDDVCDSYRVYLQYKPSLQRRYDDLRGKVLGCWCHPERCHGNELANEANGVTPPDEYERVGCHR
jgi:hypothetical protein